MNKFIPLTGGHKLQLDEFVLVQNSFLEGFNALVKKINPTGNCILDGVIIDQSPSTIITVTEGYIAIKDPISNMSEIYKVDSQTLTKSLNPLDVLYFKPIQTTIAPSPVVYKSTLSKIVHLERKAVLKYKGVADTDGQELSNFYYTGSIVEGTIFAWRIPVNKTLGDYFTSTGIGINSMLGSFICNGENNTIDLRGMFLPMATNVPASPGNLPSRTNLDSVASNLGEGGRNKKLITQAQLPNYQLPVTDPGHSHGFTLGSDRASGSANGNFAKTDSNTVNKTTQVSVTGITVNSGGSGQDFDVRPASYYLYYIEKRF